MLIQDPQALPALRSLRKLLLGGEALPNSLVKQLNISGQILNMYGPTETTVWSTTHAVTEAEGSIPIGRPIANTEIYIVDRQFQPVPAGIPGELLIGGAGVVRGYLNRPELTAERFIAHPFSNRPGARLYRTGDLARFLPDGKIDFLGRLDHQVKLRGFRIELGEIEAALCEHPQVREGVVVLREFSPGDKRLVAYLAPANGQPNVAEIRTHLKGRLPDYMVPSAFEVLERLPLTPNGKVDRKALPQPAGIRSGHDRAFAPAQNQVEKRIVAIWQKLLHVEQIGLNDNFFELGGHSLLVVQAHARLSEEFQTELSILKLFQYPTISSLAMFLNEEQKEKVSFQKVRERARRQKGALGGRKQSNEVLL
jgi:acyl carrier protein